MLEEGVVLGSETGSLRYGWMLVRTRQAIIKTVPKTELWIEDPKSMAQLDPEQLDQVNLEELKEYGYKKNWLEKNLRSRLKNTGMGNENSLTIRVNNKVVSVQPEDVPARNLLPLETDVYFSVNNDTIFNHGRYLGAATPTKDQPFSSVIEDDNGNELLIRTTDLMIHASLVDGIMSPTPPSSPLSMFTK
jgi:hypothetical protein